VLRFSLFGFVFGTPQKNRILFAAKKKTEKNPTQRAQFFHTLIRGNKVLRCRKIQVGCRRIHVVVFSLDNSNMLQHRLFFHVLKSFQYLTIITLTGTKQNLQRSILCTVQAYFLFAHLLNKLQAHANVTRL